MNQDFDRDMFVLLHDVARLSRVEADKRARVMGMTRAQWGLLLRLARNPGLSQKEVADMLEVEPISVARLVDRLAAAGLVERSADEQDRRIWRLHLLPRATAMLEEITRQREILAAFIAEGISDSTRETIIAGLQRMKTNLLRAEPAPGLKEST
ncbi:MarR family winged helix-turn-helix transcriptional regulator [Acidocella sp.]|uniref:MarR family winged helix-turn-helix transcriptional regulator n=1 Tax=Acidocella sp. TaxID=50710 RepID=UPI002611681E|nr:MarR family transcriptional regulator [Acidocella sp.]MDD2795106.1 MarR family transcriptional regulator [Acidocella sp.]